MSWLARWLWRHRMLSLLGLVLSGCAAVWMRVHADGPQGSPTDTAMAPAPTRPAPPPTPAQSAGIADMDTPAMRITTAEIDAELDAPAAIQPGPYPGSALPAADGSAPTPEYLIKANEGSKLCHSPSSPYYKRMKAAVWFRDEHDAVTAGFRPWARNR